MAKVAKKKIQLGSTAGNSRRGRVSQPTLRDVVATVGVRTRAQVNRRLNQRAQKDVRAITSMPLGADYDEPETGWATRMMRWCLGLLMLPLCWVTSWTFFSQFTNATLDHGFWKMPAFWYFATGALLMTGWFFTGLLRWIFLYLYVLGHELTHILTIWAFRGRVADWDATLEGGYVTTDKTNIVIALSPYFVPLWATAGVLVYLIAGLFADLPPVADKIMFGWVGFFWAFHLLWTLWMIPRDQPDLRENGTFLSLVIIYLANQVVLSVLLCATATPLGFGEFAREWMANAARGTEGVLLLFRELGMRL